MHTVLVIDDNKSVRDSLRFLFLRRDYEVLLAENGAEGLALAATRPIDCAMVDIMMPGMNGIDVCRLLHERAAAAGQRIAVWTMTGAYSADLAKRSLAAGAVALLAKPFDFTDLLRRLDDYYAAPPPVVAPPPATDVPPSPPN